MQCKILRPNGVKLENDASNAAATDSPFFPIINLHSFFSECSIIANGKKTFSSNGNYAQKAFIEAIFSQNQGAKDTWLDCQGKSYEVNLMNLLKPFSLHGQLKLGIPQRSFSLEENVGIFPM